MWETGIPAAYEFSLCIKKMRPGERKERGMFRFRGLRTVCAGALIGLTMLLTGCSGEDYEVLFLRDAEVIEEMPPSTGEEAGGKEKEKEPSVEEVGFEKRGELPQYVFQTGDGHLLLLGDRVELMNVNTLETERCLEDTELEFSFHDFVSCRFATCNEDYLVVGNYLQMEKEENSNFMTSSEEPVLMLVRFSRNLDILEVLNLNEVLGAARGIDKYALDRRGTRLFCASLDECFLYDLEKGERISYPLPEEKLYAVSALGYMEAEDRVLFTAFYDDGNGDDLLHVFGSMDSDGTNLQHEKKQTQEWGGEIWCFRDFALIEDGKLYESGEKGKVFYYGADGRMKEYVLADEYTSVQPSETGKLFAVQSREWAEDGNNIGYTVRVYESESGKLIQTIDCPLSKIGENAMLWQCIVSEERKSVLLLFCDRETRENPHFQVVKMKE